MRLGKTKNEERSRAAGYQVVARSLLETARGRVMTKLVKEQVGGEASVAK